MPQMPPAIKGFVTLRGGVTPVVSTRLRFGIAEDAYTDRTSIIIVQVDGSEFGLIVDTIEETVTIEPGSVSPPPDIANSPYIIGVAQKPDGSVVQPVDLPALLAEH